MKKFLNFLEMNIIFNFLNVFKNINIIKIFNKFLKNVLKKKKKGWNNNFNDLTYDVNIKIIKYLKLFFNNILIKSMLKFIANTLILLLFSDKNVNN